MTIKIFEKFTSLFKKNTENIVTGAKKVNQEIQPKLTQKPDEFISGANKYDPEVEARQYLTSEEGKNAVKKCLDILEEVKKNI